jgi:hypothetical protein
MLQWLQIVLVIYATIPHVKLSSSYSHICVAIYTHTIVCVCDNTYNCLNVS